MKYYKLPYVDTTKKISLKRSLDAQKNVRPGNKVKILLKRIVNNILAEIAYFIPSHSLRVFCHRLRGVSIGENVSIGAHVTLDRAYPELITLESESALAAGCLILSHSQPIKHFEHILESFAAEVIIKKGAWVGVNAIILPKVTIGAYSIVTAGSVVISNVADKSIVRGNPAKVVARLP